MQLHDTDNTVTVSGGEAIQMTMDANSAVGFSLSIDKLYTYKIESVIREICSNARDSHVEAGKENVPFDIFLPSDLSPYLVIKDRGMGLNKENAIKYLSKLYSSSKQNTNKAVGAYGIGAKSPFAISDSYNIETIKDGVKCSFQFFRSGRSLPQLMLLDESETDEPNGVTFRIHVRDLQRSKYEDALHTQLFMFNPKPNIDGTPWPYDLPKLKQSFNNIKVYEARRQRDFFGVYALEMGGVTYPFDPASVDPDCEALFAGIKRTIENSDIVVITVPIGSVEVPGDRERVEYSDFTIANLKKHLTTVGEMFTSENCKEYIEEFNASINILALETARYNFYHKIQHLASFVKDSSELQFSRTFKPYTTPIINVRGEVIDASIVIEANKITKSDLGWGVSAPYFEQTEIVKTHKIVDGSYEFEKDSEGKYLYEEKVITTHLPKFSYTTANRIYNSTAYNFDKYQELKILHSTFITLLSSYIVVLVDTSAKPIGKTIELWQQEDGDHKSDRILVVKANDKSYDMRMIAELYDTLLNDSGAKVYKLSELKYTAKAKEKVTNATGFRKLLSDYIIFTPERGGNRYSRKPLQIKLSELTEYLESERSEKDQFFAYAFIDVNTNQIYLDEEHTKPVDGKQYHLMTCGYGFALKDCLLMSKTTAKKYLERIQESGMKPLSDFMDMNEFIKTRPPEYKTLLNNTIELLLFTKGQFNKVADEFKINIYCELFSNNDPRHYRYQSIDAVSLCDYLFSTSRYTSSSIKTMAVTPEDRALWSAVVITLRQADIDSRSYAGRMCNAMYRNHIVRYVDKGIIEDLEQRKKSVEHADNLGEYLMRYALTTLPNADLIKISRTYQLKNLTSHTLSFN